jgi:putative ABC transport system ATP-binding protein
VTGARVRVEHVRRRFDHETVLRDVSLRVEPAQLVALSGPSGSGKTTLLQILGGLDHPDAGDVWIGDQHISALRHPVALRRHVVGFVFQLHHLLPALSAQANVELPLVAAGVRASERRRRALEALGRVGLGARARHRPEQLSGGERQRVALARAIVHRPQLLLADEPTGGLDRVATAEVLGLLAELRDDDGTTIIAVSHDPTLGGYADRRVTLADGVLHEPAAHADAVQA